MHSNRLNLKRSLLLIRQAVEQLKSIDLTTNQAARFLGTAYCLLGDTEEAKSLYETDEVSPYSRVQLAILANMADEAERSAQLLKAANLSQQEAVELLSTFTEQMADLDWRPHLIEIAYLYPRNEQLWRLWLLYGAKLGYSNHWTEALGWYQSGIRI